MDSKTMLQRLELVFPPSPDPPLGMRGKCCSFFGECVLVITSSSHCFSFSMRDLGEEL